MRRGITSLCLIVLALSGALVAWRPPTAELPPPALALDRSPTFPVSLDTPAWSAESNAALLADTMAVDISPRLELAIVDLVPEVLLEESVEAPNPVAEAMVPEVPLERPAIYTASRFRLPVPFRTQKDGSTYQGSNCGPAALGMILEAYGMSETNADLRFLTHTYQGTVGRRGGTALQHTATVGGDFGLEPIGLYQGTDFHRWTVEDIRAQVQAGNAVIPLVKYRQLPGYENSGVRFDHYIVIHGLDGDLFLYHDPAQQNPEQGAGRWISSEQLDRAIAQASVPRQAVAFGGGVHGQLPALRM